jgi:hypothetical protein
MKLKIKMKLIRQFREQLQQSVWKCLKIEVPWSSNIHFEAKVWTSGTLNTETTKAHYRNTEFFHCKNKGG